MRLFLDTNVLVAAVTDEPETGPVAANVLNADLISFDSELQEAGAVSPHDLL